MQLEKIMQYNKNFSQSDSKAFSELACSNVPTKKIAVFSCMDTRLVTLLETAMGLKRGEAVVIKIAGNYLKEMFGSTLLSLVISIFEQDVQEIFVVGHEDCGVSHVYAPELIKKMLERGISSDAIKMVEDDLATYINHYHKPHDNVLEVVAKIHHHPLIPWDIPIHGLIMNPDSGELKLLINGYENVSLPIEKDTC